MSAVAEHSKTRSSRPSCAASGCRSRRRRSATHAALRRGARASTRSTCSSWCSRSSGRSASSITRRSRPGRGSCGRSTRSPSSSSSRGRSEVRMSRRAGGHGPARRNAFTVDLEEWFHICGVGGRSRPSTGTPCRRASCRRRGWLLDDARSRRRRAPRSSSSAGSPSATRGWSQRSLRAGHEIGSHGHAHQRARTSSAPDGVPRRPPRAASRALTAAGVTERAHVPRAGMVDQRPLALGARTCWRREGLHARREHGAGEDRRQSRLIRAIRTSGTPRPGRSSRCRRSWPIGSAR